MENNLGAEQAQHDEPARYTLAEAAELLKTQGGMLRGEITITRAATGKAEHYQLEMTPTKD